LHLTHPTNARLVDRTQQPRPRPRPLRRQHVAARLLFNGLTQWPFHHRTRSIATLCLSPADAGQHCRTFSRELSTGMSYLRLLPPPA
jgi:hypothetical protein